MTVSSGRAKIVHVFSRAVSNYVFNFKVFEARHIQVMRFGDEPEGAYLRPVTDYAVGGLGEDSGGSVTLTAAGAAGFRDGDQVVILRSLDFVQETDYKPQGKFPADTHERALDLLTMMCQELRETLGRALLAPANIERPIPYSELTALRDEMVAAIAGARDLMKNLLSDAEGTIRHIIDNAVGEMKATAAKAVAELQAAIAAAEARVDEILKLMTEFRPVYRKDWTAGTRYLPNDLVRGPDGMLYLVTQTVTAGDFGAAVDAKILTPWGVPLGGDERGQQKVWRAEAVAKGGRLQLPIPYFPARKTLLLYYDNIPCYPKDVDAAYQYEEVGTDPNELSWEVAVNFDIEVGTPMMMVIMPSAFTSSLERVKGLEERVADLADAALVSAGAAEASEVAAGAAAANAAGKALAAADSADRAALAEGSVESLANQAGAAKDAADQAATNARESATVAALSAAAAAESASQADMYRGLARADSDSAQGAALAAAGSMNNAKNSADDAATKADEAATRAAAALDALNQFLAKLAAGLDASDIKTGTLDIARIPDGAREILKTVESEEKKLLLTYNDVQHGDSVRVIQPDGTSKRYWVIDDSLLSPDGVEPGSEEAFDQYSAGQAASVDWGDIINKPENLVLGAHALSHARGGSDEITPASIGAPKNQFTLADQAPTSDNLSLTNTAVATKFQEARNLFAYLLGKLDSATGLMPIDSGGTGAATAPGAALALFPDTLESGVKRLAGLGENGAASGTVSLSALAGLLSEVGLAVPWANVSNPPTSMAPTKHGDTHVLENDPIPPTNNVPLITTLGAALAAGTAFTVPPFIVGSGRLKVYLEGLKCFNGTNETYHQYMEIGEVGAQSTTIKFNFQIDAGLTIEACAPRI